MRTALFGFLSMMSIVACTGGIEPVPAQGDANNGGTSTSPSGGSKTSGGGAGGDETSTTNTTTSPKTSVPTTARSSSAACTGTRPAGQEADPRAEDTCTSDAECTAGIDGRCSFFNAHRECTYHACQSDSDCGSGTEVCGCGLGIDKRNVCLSLSKCRTNDDCSGGQYCALSVLPGIPVGDGAATFYGQTWGYFCTTGGDACRSGDDCAAQQHDHSCVYYTTQSKWACGGGP
jgi:hypothetical protein